ncbi:MAG TPA: hypothetical protein VK941_11765 [Gillisia sp.]|nr:hypothetical protein [Gillisia sp.]
MIKKLLFTLLIGFFISVSTQAQDIEGSWSWNSQDGVNMFTIDLIRTSENNYRGNHCSVYLNGDRLDCRENEQDSTIVLIRKSENIFQGSIRSGLSNSIGNVQLQYLPNEDSILFSLKSNPKGEYYMPLEGRLQRN